MAETSNWAREQLLVLAAGWDRLQRAINELGPGGLDLRISAGWTAKEMLAHLAFWEETSVPVIQCLYRGGPEVPVEAWYGGDDLELAAGDEWPSADVHNAREVRWAQSRSGAEVLDRLARARQTLVGVLATVTDEEGRGPIGEQWSGAAICRHVDDHLAKIPVVGDVGHTPPALPANPGGAEGQWKVAD